MCNVGFQLLWRQPQKERASAEHSLVCSLHQRLPQREGKTQQGHPGSNLTWVSTSWCPASCKQQVVTLVFEASHHFWWAPLKQKQRSVPEPNRIQMVLQSLSLFHTHTHTHTHFVSIIVCTPSPLWNPAVSMVTLARALCQMVQIYLSTDSFCPQKLNSLLQMASNWVYIELSVRSSAGSYVASLEFLIW